jgi:hypothetical protein
MVIRTTSSSIQRPGIVWDVGGGGGGGGAVFSTAWAACATLSATKKANVDVASLIRFFAFISLSSVSGASLFSHPDNTESASHRSFAQ